MESGDFRESYQEARERTDNTIQLLEGDNKRLRNLVIDLRNDNKRLENLVIECKNLVTEAIEKLKV